MLPWACGRDYAACTVRLSSWCPGVGICGPVLPTQMTRLHHSGLLSHNSYLITGQIYQSDVIIYTSGTISWIQTTRTTFIFYLKKSCNCQCKWQLDMQYWYAENSWGKTVFVDGINTMYGYNWHLGRWHCECIRKSQQYISINQNVPLTISLYQMKIWIQIWRPVDKIPFTPRPDSQTVTTNVIVTSKAGNLKSSYNIKGWLLTTG